MDRAITNVIRFAGIDLTSAIQMAGENAQKLFPKAGGKILPGGTADLVLFEYQNELIVRSTWVEGKKIF
jgi:N-acetylglucosamine-6-phosphate deacetylase